MTTTELLRNINLYLARNGEGKDAMVRMMAEFLVDNELAAEFVEHLYQQDYTMRPEK